jgi:hypothetical protein
MNDYLLGKKVEKPKAEKPEWQPVPGKPHLEQNAEGKMRTNIPENESAAWTYTIRGINFAIEPLDAGEYFVGGLLKLTSVAAESGRTKADCVARFEFKGWNPP